MTATRRCVQVFWAFADDQTGTTLAELDSSIDKSKIRANEGEAALYGITYDDSSYDYMAHLRPIEGGWDSVMIAAPKGSGVAPGMKTDKKGKGRELFVDDDVLASKQEISLQEAYSREANIPQELQGLQPDMDPHLRQVLEALEDDAFVDDEAEEAEGGAEGGEWWGELLKGGEAEEWEDREEFEFAEWGVDEEGGDEAPELVDGGDHEETWEDRFKAFKRAEKERGDRADSDEEIERSVIADSISSMVSGMDDLIVRGGKKRHGKRGPSDATGMSMSSSSMYRTQGLRDLDARFDKVELDYDIEEEDEEEWNDSASTVSGWSNASGMSTSSRSSLFSNSSAAPPEVSREDFDAIMDDFLENFEVVGNRMQPALGGTGLTGAEKLRIIRSAVEGEGADRDANRELVLEIERLGRGKKAPKEKKEKVKEEGEEMKWDVETILCELGCTGVVKQKSSLTTATYTNTENHPAVIGTRSAAEKRRRAEERAKAAQTIEEEAEEGEDDDEDDSGSETETEAPKVTVARAKGESKEERKARKAAVKAERSVSSALLCLIMHKDTS